MLLASKSITLFHHAQPNVADKNNTAANCTQQHHPSIIQNLRVI
jgi:hypothetical protein